VLGASFDRWIFDNSVHHPPRQKAEAEMIVTSDIACVYSAVDVICSFNLALSSLVVPRETPGVWGARGTQGTCEASGFVSQFSHSLGLYAAFLCLYYVLILRFGVREESISRRLQPFLHSFAFGYPLIFAIIMLVKDMYNPSNVVVG
jgi:hypothetical protein